MTTPNKYQANGKKWPNGTIWMNWQMVNGNWQRLDFKRGLPEDQKATGEYVPKATTVDWVGFWIYIALLMSIIGLCGLAAHRLGAL